MVFDDADMLGSLLETGFRIPLHNIGIKDKDSIVNSLKDYHCIIKVSKSDCVLYNRPRPNCRSWLFSQGYTFIDAISTVIICVLNFSTSQHNYVSIFLAIGHS